MKSHLIKISLRLSRRKSLPTLIMVQFMHFSNYMKRSLSINLKYFLIEWFWKWKVCFAILGILQLMYKLFLVGVILTFMEAPVNNEETFLFNFFNDSEMIDLFIFNFYIFLFYLINCSFSSSLSLISQHCLNGFDFFYIQEFLLNLGITIH